jgi:predicted DNA-binding antitoxin AbrB/MazE fold protein
MTTAVKAVYEDGVFKPKEPVKLPENTEVEVLIPGETLPEQEAGWKAFERFAGLWKDAQETDIAERHDDHLYGRD